METSVLQREDRAQGRLAPAAMAVGGAISLVGSFLTWASVRLGGAAARSRRPLAGKQRLGRQGAVPSFSLNGLSTPGGKTVLALSIALILVAGLAFLAYWFWVRLGAMAVGLILGVIALVWSASQLASPSSMFGGAAGIQLSRRGIPVSAGVGLYLAVAGAAVAVIASAAWLVMSRPRWAAPATLRGTPAPSGPAPRPDEQPTSQPPPAANPGLATD